MSLFDTSGFGLEIGPSYSPLLPKSNGYNVETVDHADAETLREKYKLELVDCSRIEDVDYVSDGRSLVDLIGQKERYDFIYASHVIEHVPDIIRFIKDCETLLKPDGVLVLVVPDKRFCFDLFQPVTTVGQALQAFHEGRMRHTPGMVFDHLSLTSRKAGAEVWLEPTFDDVELHVTPESALHAFESAKSPSKYIDIHGWHFTPSYFSYFIATLRRIGYLQSGEHSIHVNEKDQLHLHEFYAVLSKAAPLAELADIDLLKASEAELQEIKLTRAASGPEITLAEKSHKIQALSAQLAETQEQLTRERHERQALLASTSWKATAPLRYLKTAILRGRSDEADG